MVLVGCGLTLDLDPPDPEGVDAGALDAALARDASQDAALIDAAMLDAAMFDAGLCRSEADCELPDRCATARCEAGMCVYTRPAEVCDGEDQDCDGAIDEGSLLTCLIDTDGDGFGAPHALCECPAEVVDVGGDCHDVERDSIARLVHPGQPAYFFDPYRRADGTLSHDYDCDGLESPRFDMRFTTCRRDATSCAGSGWSGPMVAACGTRRDYTYCMSDAMGGCVAVLGMSDQYCR